MAKSGPRMAKARALTIWKPGLFRALDALARDPAKLSEAIAMLDGGDSLVDVGVRHGVIDSDPSRRDHIERHWLADAAFAQMLKEALVYGGGLVLETGLPADCYWTFAGETPEVAVSQNSQQITMIVVAPFPDIETDGEESPQEGIRIFRCDPPASGG